MPLLFSTTNDKFAQFASRGVCHLETPFTTGMLPSAAPDNMMFDCRKNPLQLQVDDAAAKRSGKPQTLTSEKECVPYLNGGTWQRGSAEAPTQRRNNALLFNKILLKWAVNRPCSLPALIVIERG